MPDLKAAAKEMRDISGGLWYGRESRDVCILAAQALEAWAWQQERKATVQPYNGGWLCGTIDNSGHADTPLGAVLAAMEGEKDGEA